MSEEVTKQNQPIELLDSILGIGRGHAELLLAEIGIGMIFQSNFLQLRIYVPGLERFQVTMKVLEKKSGKKRKGNKKLRAALVEAAHSAARTKNAYLSSQYQRLSARVRKKLVAVAVGPTILTLAYHMLNKRVPDIELGTDYFDGRKKLSRNSLSNWKICPL
ncbi:MAG: hypothetical protein ACXVNF_15080 [Neobacillus sp.]